MSSTRTDEIAAAAARLIVEDGMEYGEAKRRAARLLGRGATRATALPGNDILEEQVRAYLTLFCADTQPAELAALRAVAADWMQRLAAFRPHLTGAVWRGTATRHSAVHIELYCDDSKAAEFALIDLNVDYEVSSMPRARGQRADVLSVASQSAALDELVTVHLTVLDYDDLRGSLRPDARGRAQRGDLGALRAAEGIE